MNDPYYQEYEDGRKWEAVGKYDLISPENDMIIEFKNPQDTLSHLEVIFQAILTAVCAGKTFNWYGSHILSGKKCVPAYAIDRRSIELEQEMVGITPSDRSSDWYKAHFPIFKAVIKKELRDFPSKDERDRVIKAKSLHLKYTDEEFKKAQETPCCFECEELELLLETKNWRIDPSDRDKNNAFYTPMDVVEQVKNLVCKYWKFEQIWDCAAGDGHLVSWHNNVILSDISPKITYHNGHVLDYLTIKQPIKGFHEKGIIIVNPSYHKRHVNHLISFAENHKLRICIFAPACMFPIKRMPIVDGFYSSGWGNGSGRNDRGQIILLLDYRDCQMADKKTLSDGTIFECIPDESAYKTKKGYYRYVGTASDAIFIAKTLDINPDATINRDKTVAGRFIASSINNYCVDHNGKGNKTGYGKHNANRKTNKLKNLDK